MEGTVKWDRLTVSIVIQKSPIRIKQLDTGRGTQEGRTRAFVDSLALRKAQQACIWETVSVAYTIGVQRPNETRHDSLARERERERDTDTTD